METDITLKARFYSKMDITEKVCYNTKNSIFNYIGKYIKENIWISLAFMSDRMWDTIWFNINSENFIKKKIKQNILKAIKDEKYKIYDVTNV